MCIAVVVCVCVGAYTCLGKCEHSSSIWVCVEGVLFLYLFMVCACVCVCGVYFHYV